MAAVRPDRERPRPPSAAGRVTARGRGLTPPACGTLYGLTDGRGARRGRGWVSAVTATRTAATRWPPTSHPAASAGSKGKRRSGGTPGGGSQSVENTLVLKASLNLALEYSESGRPGKKRNSTASGRRFDRSRPHADAVSLIRTLSPAPAEPFWRWAVRELCVTSEMFKNMTNQLYFQQ